MKNLIIALIMACLLSLPSWVQATTTSCDGSQSDCQAKITAATAGDTILWPAGGSYTWTTGVTVGKPLTINGNGTTLTQSGVLPYGFFRITGFTSSSLVRITGFTFNGVGRNSPQVVVDNVTLTSLRIDHNTFNLGNYALDIGGSKGVIDNNYFYNCNGWAGFSAGTRDQADASWLDLTPGTSDFLFFEDNHLIINGNYDVGNALDAAQGGKYVYRYNTFDYTAAPGGLGTQGVFSLHGSASGGCGTGFGGAGYWQYDEGSTKCVRRSPSLVEIYNNTISGTRIDCPLGFRGGSFLYYNNTHNDSYGGKAVIRMTEEEFRTDESGQWNPTRSAWPGEDHINNTFIWNNTFDGVAQTDDNVNALDFNSYCTGSGAPITCCTGAVAGTCNLGQANAIIKQNRDFFTHAPQASGGKETWTCAEGVTNCHGASSSYPTDGSTIATYGTMSFLASGANAYYPYTAYTYPHPLTLSGASSAPCVGGKGVGTYFVH